MLTFHMICCVHSRWVKASVQCFYSFSHRSHARLLIRQRSPRVYFAWYEHNRTSTFSLIFIETGKVLYSLSTTVQKLCHQISEWPIFFVDSAGSISCVRLQQQQQVTQFNYFCFLASPRPTPHNLFSRISGCNKKYFCCGPLRLRLFGQYFSPPSLTLMDAARLQILTSGKICGRGCSVITSCRLW